jgi:hypothetical protein
MNKTQQVLYMGFFMRFAWSLRRADRRATYNGCTEIIGPGDQKWHERDIPVCLALQEPRQHEAHDQRDDFPWALLNARVLLVHQRSELGSE